MTHITNVIANCIGELPRIEPAGTHDDQFHIYLGPVTLIFRGADLAGLYTALRNVGLQDVRWEPVDKNTEGRPEDSAREGNAETAGAPAGDGTRDRGDDRGDVGHDDQGTEPVEPVWDDHELISHTGQTLWFERVPGDTMCSEAFCTAENTQSGTVHGRPCRACDEHAQRPEFVMDADDKQTECGVTGCHNPATHTWSGHPTCDYCATPGTRKAPPPVQWSEEYDTHDAADDRDRWVELDAMENQPVRRPSHTIRIDVLNGDTKSIYDLMGRLSHAMAGWSEEYGDQIANMCTDVPSEGTA